VDGEKSSSARLTIYPSFDFTLGLSNALISHKPSGGETPERPKPAQRERRGQNGISSYGRRMVRSGAVLIQEKFRKECLTFGTATLPTVSQLELVELSNCWSELTRQFKQELTRLLYRRGLSTDWVDCTEIQELRWKRKGQLAPHLHWVCQGRRSRREAWSIKPGEIRGIWERLISHFLGRQVDCKAATRIERVRKSAARYLSKYMSKGGKVLESIKEAGLGAVLPTAWYGMSAALTRLVKLKTIRCDEASEFMLQNYQALIDIGHLRWAYRIFIDMPQPHGEVIKILVGIVGEFANTEAITQLVDLHAAA
jgi:hypothetical protein